MNEFPFQKFVDLVTFDRLQIELGKKAERTQGRLNELESAIQRARAAIEAAKKAERDAQKAVDASELEMKVLDDKRSALTERLDEVSGHKEYVAVMQELEVAKNKQHAFESVLVKSWNDLEATKKSAEEAVTVHNESIAKFQQEVDALNADRAVVNQEIAELVQQRSSKTAGIPAEWLEKYEMMRSRVDNPVVEVEQGSCSACFYPVTQQGLQRLRRKALIQCHDCFRFLYLKEAHEAA